MARTVWPIALWCLAGLGTATAWAGGSGLNVVVVVNQASTISLELGNYYCEKREVPPQNVLFISWTGGNIVWSYSDYTNTLLAPLFSLLATRRLTNQVDYVVLSMDIPYQVLDSISGTFDSTTAATYYGFKQNTTPPPGAPPSCSLPLASSNAYAGSELPFRSIAPGNVGYTNLMTTMITATNLAVAKRAVDQGVAGDNVFPPQTAWLGKSADIFRNFRYWTFDNAIFDARLRGNYSLQRTNWPDASNLGSILGLQSGKSMPYSFAGSSFVPGSMADNLTSYGGQIFQNPDASGHPNILHFLEIGASGCYGTVDEPCGYFEKFPTPSIYFFQARGFNLAECYYQGLTNPYQGLVLGEPLTAPFATPASGSWIGLPDGALLTGTTNLSLQFSASDARHPVQQVDLFVDGLWYQTLTNLPPSRSNFVNVVIGGQSVSYLVPQAATLKTVADGLTATLESNTTGTLATAHGDRIELQSLALAKTGAQVSLSVSNSIGSGAAQTARLWASAASFLDSATYGIRNFLVDQGGLSRPTNGTYLLMGFAKTNGAIVQIGVTNPAAGTNISQMLATLVSQVGTNPQLTGPDGCVGEDYISYAASLGDPADPRAEFNLRARAPGWQAAQLQATLTGSLSYFVITPSGAQTLEDNLMDLRPRAHLYVTTGLSTLPLTFPFDTTAFPDGHHQLAAVAYEGSSVRTQTRLVQNVIIKNGPLAATFGLISGASNTVFGTPLQFLVQANASNISRIELFGTGGALTNAAGQSSVAFSLAGTNLGMGLHPFYALVTDSGGKQYRTPTLWVRLVPSQPLSNEPPFKLSASGYPPQLSWPATAGRTYNILSTTNLSGGFQTGASVFVTNSPALWTETDVSARQRFYRAVVAN